MSEWIDHDGNGMPVTPETRVQVRWRRYPGADTRPVPANYFLGFWDGDDIASYRLETQAVTGSAV